MNLDAASGFRSVRAVLSALAGPLALAPLLWAICAIQAQAQDPSDRSWTGNFARNAGFEEDWVNENAEGHVLSFKGDWFYNQQDLKPDFWNFKGAWTWSTSDPKSGKHTLVLAESASAEQSYPGMAYQEGGGAWGAAGPTPMKLADAKRFARARRATVWVRGTGTLALGDVVAKAEPAAGWQQLRVEMPADKIDPTLAMTVTLTGPGEFDDLVVVEQRPQEPNLLVNGDFERSGDQGSIPGFSGQRKYRSLGPTYYVWTDWNHYFRRNRGPVAQDGLINYAGVYSLRFDVFPGDEKYVESYPIEIRQTTPGVIEVGAYVRADRIKVFDIRCVNEDGADLKGYYPIQPEYAGGGTATWGNGTFEWRYVRKFFAPPFDKPLKTIRVRLCARGFNAHTLDDAGTRSYACQVGTLWWDNVHVGEVGSTAESLRVREVAVQADPSTNLTNVSQARLDLGERLFGANKLSLTFNARQSPGQYGLKVTTTLPGKPAVVTQSPPVNAIVGQEVRLEAPYQIESLAGELKRQGTLQVELVHDGWPKGETYHFNTWPVVIDFDVARHYNLPEENPVTASLNLGVATDTLAKVARIELALASAQEPDKVVQALPAIGNLASAFQETQKSLPNTKEASYEFKLPTPAWWTDRTNLLLLKLDLSPLKVWPHDQPSRDTVLVARGVDAAGSELFRGQSDPFCRVNAPPPLPPIESVAVRADGAVLINGQPRFLTGATHQNQRIGHTPAIMAQLGLNGMRLVAAESAKFENMAKVWSDHKLYVHQARPVSGMDSTTPTAELSESQRNALVDFVKAGGMQSIVTMNTGGWEGHIADNPDARAKHEATNDWIYATTRRPLSWSHSGAANAWNATHFPYYDINFAETEMWGPMEYNVIWTPQMKRLHKRPSTWAYLPQLYDNHPFERYRFETYENIIRGSAGTLMIQGIGDPTFNRGLAGELRYLEGPLYSQEKAPAVRFEPPISHKVTRKDGKTYVLATNCGPIQVGNWIWNRNTYWSGQASHEGDTVNSMWFRPHGIRIHAMRAIPMPELIQPGDKIVQYVWLDPQETPEWVMLAVRGDGKFIHNGVLGNFDFARFRTQLGNVVMYSELEHSVWHEINYVMDDSTYQLAVRLIGQQAADEMKQNFTAAKAKLDEVAYKPAHFHNLGERPQLGQWVKVEIDASRAGLVGKLVDGFAYLTQNGRALWDYTALERDGQIVRVFAEDTLGIDRALLDRVRVHVPGMPGGTKVKALFEGREITAAQEMFVDNFVGTDTYGYEAGGVEGDMFGYVKDSNREVPRMMPSGYGYKYGPTQVHIYEIEHP